MATPLTSEPSARNQWPKDRCACGRIKMARSAKCRTCFTAWPDRFWAKVRKTSACWPWEGPIDKDGYGFVVGNDHKNVKAHRVSWELRNGPIDPALTIDHLCHDPWLCVGGATCPHRRCVNPGHLAIATAVANSMRGNGVTAQNARKTHCKHGHPFDEANTFRTSRGGRGCRLCRTAASARHYRQGRERYFDSLPGKFI